MVQRESGKPQLLRSRCHLTRGDAGHVDVGEHAVVREKEIWTLEQIMVTPISQLEFILGKPLPFALIGFADVTLITGVAVYWFEVPIRVVCPSSWLRPHCIY
ncbi:hypothetical protein [Candidatus Nitrospira salsa]